MSEVVIRAAKTEDVPSIAASVCEAYVHYIERIGKQPGPMLEDYAEVIEQFQVHVAVASGKVIGAIVLKVTDEGFYVDNVAVRPRVKGTGIGRLLLEFAESEARRQGYQSIYLATHELMTENRTLYSRIGYVEYDHRVINGYPRVFFRKALSGATESTRRTT
jgi:N-acetylglutamate synthase-like GNAT family acetyltransferase